MLVVKQGQIGGMR